MEMIEKSWPMFVFAAAMLLGVVALEERKSVRDDRIVAALETIAENCAP